MRTRVEATREVLHRDDEWISENTHVVRNKRGQYAFSLRFGPLVTFWRSNYMTICDDLRKAVAGKLKPPFWTHRKKENTDRAQPAQCTVKRSYAWRMLNQQDRPLKKL